MKRNWRLGLARRHIALLSPYVDRDVRKGKFVAGQANSIKNRGLCCSSRFLGDEFSTATVKTLQCSVIPPVSQFNAVTPDHAAYRVLWFIASSVNITGGTSSYAATRFRTMV